MNRFRKKVVAGNWKMNKSIAEAEELTSGIKRELMESRPEADVILCPPFTALKVVSDLITDTNIKLGAQDMHWEADGAFTGEISAAMLRDIYCHYVILGHSERRAFFHETDEVVNRKVHAALAANLTPITCVGETLAQREAGRQQNVVESQVRRSLDGLGPKLGSVIVAYEPVWAIGTGQTATPGQAQEMHAFVRGILGDMADAAADSMRILYGGSVKPANAQDLFSQADIDGGLIGGAALETRSFVEIVRAAL